MDLPGVAGGIPISISRARLSVSCFRSAAAHDLVGLVLGRGRYPYADKYAVRLASEVGRLAQPYLTNLAKAIRGGLLL